MSPLTSTVWRCVQWFGCQEMVTTLFAFANLTNSASFARWNSWFRWHLVSCCGLSESVCLFLFPFRSLSLHTLTLALNYSDKMCCNFQCAEIRMLLTCSHHMKRHCDIRTHSAVFVVAITLVNNSILLTIVSYEHFCWFVSVGMRFLGGFKLFHTFSTLVNWR